MCRVVGSAIVCHSRQPVSLKIDPQIQIQTPPPSRCCPSPPPQPPLPHLPPFCPCLMFPSPLHCVGVGVPLGRRPPFHWAPRAAQGVPSPRRGWGVGVPTVLPLATRARGHVLGSPSGSGTGARGEGLGGSPRRARGIYRCKALPTDVPRGRRVALTPGHSPLHPRGGAGAALPRSACTVGAAPLHPLRPRSRVLRCHARGPASGTRRSREWGPSPESELKV